MLAAGQRARLAAGEADHERVEELGLLQVGRVRRVGEDAQLVRRKGALVRLRDKLTRVRAPMRCRAECRDTAWRRSRVGNAVSSSRIPIQPSTCLLSRGLGGMAAASTLVRLLLSRGWLVERAPHEEGGHARRPARVAANPERAH